jgi:hypothetical protein
MTGAPRSGAVRDRLLAQCSTIADATVRGHYLPMCRRLRELWYPAPSARGAGQLTLSRPALSGQRSMGKAMSRLAQGHGRGWPRRAATSGGTIVPP